MRVGNMDGFCVGEPWNHRAIMDGIGITANTTPGHLERPPRKGAGHHGRLRQEVPQHHRAVMMAVIEASRWIDAGLPTR
jgi:nitrate/nitrite transport system substrate-binding protein